MDSPCSELPSAPEKNVAVAKFGQMLAIALAGEAPDTSPLLGLQHILEGDRNP